MDPLGKRNDKACIAKTKCKFLKAGGPSRREGMERGSGERRLKALLESTGKEKRVSEGEGVRTSR